MAEDKAVLNVFVGHIDVSIWRIRLFEARPHVLFATFGILVVAATVNFTATPELIHHAVENAGRCIVFPHFALRFCIGFGLLAVFVRGFLADFIDRRQRPNR